MSTHDETRDALEPAASAGPLTGTFGQTSEQVASASRSDDTPDAVPGYELLGELGRGGMGVVYRARDTRLNREVALKMILRAGASRVTVARFWAEAEVMAAVKHPHVVQVHELGEHDNRPFMAMEFVSGGSLEQRLERGPMVPRAAAELLTKIASGVAAAHELDIVHRDLKPANVLLAADGAPKVADFGIAKRRAHNVTQTQAVMGTPAYMAPEQAAGGAKFVGPQADVWALGVILYECLAGNRPFDGETVQAVLSEIQSAEPPPLRTWLGSVPRDLETIVSKCLSKEPEHRSATAGELAADLERFVRGEPIAARPVGPVERFARWVRRKPSTAAAYGFSSLAVLLAVVVFVVFGFWRSAESARDEADRLRGLAVAGRAEEERLRAVADKALVGEAAARKDVERERDRLARIGYGRNVRFAQDYLRRADPARAAALLEATPPDLRGWEYGYLLGGCQEWRTQLAGSFVDLHTRSRIAPGDVRYAAYSRDGSKIVCAREGGPVRVLDANTWATLAELEGHTSPVEWAAFSPDGSKIVTGCRNGTAHVWDVAGRKIVLELRMRRSLPRGPSFSPDGSKVLGDGPDGGTSCVWEAKTGKRLLTLKGEDAAFSPDGSQIVTADSEIRIWNAATGALIRKLDEPDQQNYAPSFSADGSKIVCCGETDPPRVWNAATGKLLISMDYLRHARNPPWVAEFSPDGKRILTAGAINGPLQLWDAESGDELLTLPGSGVCAHFSPDGTRILTVEHSQNPDEGCVVIYDSRALERASRPREHVPPPRTANR